MKHKLWHSPERGGVFTRLEAEDLSEGEGEVERILGLREEGGGAANVLPSVERLVRIELACSINTASITGLLPGDLISHKILFTRTCNILPGQLQGCALLTEGCGQLLWGCDLFLQRCGLTKGCGLLKGVELHCTV